MASVALQTSFPVTITNADWDSNKQRFVKKLGASRDFSPYQVAAVGLSMYNSTQNIRAAYNNNTVTVRFPALFTSNPVTGVSLGASPVNYWDLPIVFPDGWYTLENLVAYIWNEMYLIGLYAPTTDGTDYTCFFNIEASDTTYGTRMTFPLVQASSSYTLPPNSSWSFLTGGAISTVTFTIPTGSMFGSLIGFGTGVYGNSATNAAIASTLCPVINVISGFLFCTNVVNNILTSPSNMFYSTALLASNGNQITPFINPFYVQCSGGNVWELEVWITDQSGNQYVPFDTEFVLMLNFVKPR